MQKPKLALKACSLGLQKAPEETLVHTPHGSGEEMRPEARRRGAVDWTGDHAAVTEPGYPRTMLCEIP